MELFLVRFPLAVRRIHLSLALLCLERRQPINLQVLVHMQAQAEAHQLSSFSPHAHAVVMSLATVPTRISDFRFGYSVGCWRYKMSNFKPDYNQVLGQFLGREALGFGTPRGHTSKVGPGVKTFTVVLLGGQERASIF